MTRRSPALDRQELQHASGAVLSVVVRHARSADEHYRAAAEEIGQLYMCADVHRLVGLTRSLDEPMRRAAEVERSFAGLLRELQVCIERQGGET